MRIDLPHSIRMRLDAHHLGRDFWLFWSGQTLSNLGSSLSAFALPLLTYRLTGSGVNLALTAVASYLPSLLFGLLVGAWVDRVDRRRLMVWVEVGRAAVITLLPLAALVGVLTVWMVYAVAFASATLGLFFGSAHFAAIPSLVASDDLVRANGYLHVGGSAASILGPPIGGLLLVFLPVHALILTDAASFVVSAASIAAMHSRLTVDISDGEERSSLRSGIAAGLYYVRTHQVLPALLIMLFVVNALGSAVTPELVLFAKTRFNAADAELG